MLRIYERPPGYTPAEYTVVGFLVEDLEEEMSELRHRGVTFEEYDLPHLKTENGVYIDEQRGARGAWIRDPDGNILALTQLPSTEQATLARGRADRCARGRSNTKCRGPRACCPLA